MLGGVLTVFVRISRRRSPPLRHPSSASCIPTLYRHFRFGFRRSPCAFRATAANAATQGPRPGGVRPTHTTTGRSPQASRLKWKPTPLASHLTTNQFRSETERLGLLDRLARNGCECLSRQMKAVAQLHWRDPEPVSCDSEGACQPFRSNELGLARFASQPSSSRHVLIYTAGRGSDRSRTDGTLAG